MNQYCIYILLNLTVCLAAAIAAVRFNRVFRPLVPFCLLLWIAALNELSSLYIIENGGANAWNGNIFVLLELHLLLLQFYNWQVLSKKRYVVFALCGSMLWLADNFILNSITENNSLCRIVFAFLYVFLSLETINRLIVFEKDKLNKLTTLLLAIGLLLFFACKSYVEAFNAFNMGFSIDFYAHIWFALSVVNAASNIMFAIALLCIQRKPKYILLS